MYGNSTRIEINFTMFWKKELFSLNLTKKAKGVYIVYTWVFALHKRLKFFHFAFMNVGLCWKKTPYGCTYALVVSIHGLCLIEQIKYRASDL